MWKEPKLTVWTAALKKIPIWSLLLKKRQLVKGKLKLYLLLQIKLYKIFPPNIPLKKRKKLTQSTPRIICTSVHPFLIPLLQVILVPPQFPTPLIFILVPPQFPTVPVPLSPHILKKVLNFGRDGLCAFCGRYTSTKDCSTADSCQTSTANRITPARKAQKTYSQTWDVDSCY